MRKDQRIEKAKPSIAAGLYPNLASLLKKSRDRFTAGGRLARALTVYVVPSVPWWDCRR